MPKVGIFTDTTAIFTRHDFPGAERISLIYPSEPSTGDMLQAFSQDNGRYDEYVVILSSTYLSPAVKSAQDAAVRTGRTSSIQVIDSQTTAAGLGILVQSAAAAAEQNLTALEISRMIRGNLSKVYTVLCLPDLRHLSKLGLIDPLQAQVGEMLDMVPLFTLEKGRLIPVQKVKNPRHLVDLLLEFAFEFDSLHHIAIVHALANREAEARSLRERLVSTQMDLTVSEHHLNPAVTSLLGPQSFLMFAVDQEIAYF
jgi:DegV family protein with EDD domain